MNRLVEGYFKAVGLAAHEVHEARRSDKLAVGLFLGMAAVVAAGMIRDPDVIFEPAARLVTDTAEYVRSEVLGKTA